MLTYDQLQEIAKAARFTVDLLNAYLDADNSLIEHLRIILSLTKDPDLLNEASRSLLDELILQVYPELDIVKLQPDSQEAIVPEHVTTQWVIDYFNISKSTFYEHVHEKLLFPIKKIGNRPYYLKSEVLVILVRHEKGAWTFSKMAKKAGFR